MGKFATRLTAILGFVSLWGGAAAFGQPGDEGRPDGPPPRRGSPGDDNRPPPPFGPPPPPPVMMVLDIDGDGELSAKEIGKASESLKTLDKNKDGKLTWDELRPPPPPGGQRGAGPDEFAQSIMRFDKNGDGKVTRAELPERLHRALAQGDRNRDGALDKTEAEALAKRNARRPGPPNGPPPEGPDDGPPRGRPFGGPDDGPPGGPPPRRPGPRGDRPPPPDDR